MARKSKQVIESSPKTQLFKVISPLKGRFNTKNLDYKVGDIIELTLFEKYIYRNYIEEV